MPRVKSIRSLKKTCIDFILDNQDVFCNKMPTGELENDVNSLDSEKIATSPFDELPSALLEKLTNRLIKKFMSQYKFKIQPIHKLLMTPHLRTLDLTLRRGNGRDFSYALRLAANRSPHLKTLRLGYSKIVQHTEYLNFIPKFSKLQVLDIASSASGNDCMQILGTHCVDLRELHAKRCRVSDDGIRELCVTGHCKSIRVLDLAECQVTTKGIQMALDNLLELNMLCHEALLEGLAEIAQTALDRMLKLPQYSLSALYVLQKTIYKSGSLKQSLLLCPNVTKVYLSLKMEGFKDVDLLSLLALEKICLLEIQHFAQRKRTANGEFRIYESEPTFNGGVFPLLKKFGSSLTTLSLQGSFIDVNVPAIIEFCPNLQTLNFWCKSFMTASSIDRTGNTLNKIKQPVLKKLENLHLTGIFPIEGHIPPENLFALLSSPSLVLINVMEYRTLTDKILQRATNLHSFQKLKYLYLVGCNSVKKKGIDVFMQETNPLKKKSLLGWGCFTLRDCADWKEKANAIWIKKNWHFDFFTFYFEYEDGIFKQKCYNPAVHNGE